MKSKKRYLRCALILLGLASLVASWKASASVGVPLELRAQVQSEAQIHRQAFEWIGELISNAIEGLHLRLILVDLLKFALGTGALLTALRFIRKGSAWATTKSNELLTLHGRDFRLGSKEVLKVEQAQKFLNISLFWLRRGLLALSIILYANFVLSILPQTRGISSYLYRSVVSSVGQILGEFISYLPKLLFLIILLILGYYLFRFVNFFFAEIQNGDIALPGFDRDWAQPTSRIAKIAIVSLLAVVAFPYLPGAGSEAFRGISIFLGVLFSIGSSSIVSNVISGILLTYTRAFRIGDDIEINGVIGTVIEKGLLVIRVRNYSNQFVSIPNSTVLSSNVLNFRMKVDPVYASEPPPLICIKVCLPYDYPWQQVHQVLLDAAQDCPAVLRDPPPEILHLELDPAFVAYELDAYTENPSLQAITQLKQSIQDKFDAAGLEMTAPQQIHFHNPGNARRELELATKPRAKTPLS